MERNIWTEENKIMDYENLFRADMQNKLIKMSNQVVTSESIPDLCYNYDYFINDRARAIQFISDYAERFVGALARYQKATGKVFVNVQNPMRMASLMALYAAKDIVAGGEQMKEYGPRKFALNNHNLDIVLKDINGADKQNTPRLVEKVLLTKEDFTQTCLEYTRDALLDVYKKKGSLPLSQAVKEMRMPTLTEQIVKSIIKNSYDEVTAAIANNDDINMRDIFLFTEDIVHRASLQMMKDEFELDKTDVKLDKDFLLEFQKIVETRQIHPKINFHPEKKREERNLNDRGLQKDLTKTQAREK